MIATVFLLSGTAQANTDTWTGTSGADWNTAGSWSPSGVPASGDTALFNSTGVMVNNAVANQSIKNISFDTGAGSYTIGTTTGSQLDVGSGGTIQILSTLTATNSIETINAPIVLGGSYTFANNSANGTGAGSGTLDFGGQISGSGNTLTLAGSNTNANTISGNIVTGSGGVTKSGLGTWILSGNSTYTGNTTVQAGTLQLGNGTSGSVSSSSNLAVSNGTFVLLGNSSGTTSQTFNQLVDNGGQNTGGIVLNPNGGTLTTLTLGQWFGGNNSTFNFNYAAGTTNGSTVGNDYVIWNPGNSNGIISGGFTVTDAGGTGFATESASGNKILRLVDNGSSGLVATGGVSTTNYFVNQNYSTSSSSTAGSLVLALSGNVSANTVTVDTTGLASGAGLNLGANTLTFYGSKGSGAGTTIGGFVFNGANPYSITGSGGTITDSSGAVVFNNYATGTVTIGVPISGSSTAALFTGTGTTLLTGVSTYGGTTVIGSGSTVELSGSGQLGSGNYTPGITDNGTFIDNSSAAQTISSNGISGIGSVIVSNPSASLTLAYANYYTGGTTVSAGTLIGTNNSAFSGSTLTLGNSATTANNYSATVLIGSNATVASTNIVVSANPTTGGYFIGGTTGGGTYYTSDTITLNQPVSLVSTAGATTIFYNTWTTNNNAITIGASGYTGTVQFNSAISDTGGIIVKNGTVTLGNNQSQTDNFTVNGGLLNISNVINGNLTVNGGAAEISYDNSSSVTGSTTLNGGTLIGNTFNAPVTGLITVTGSGSSAYDLGTNSIIANGGIAISNGATLTLDFGNAANAATVNIFGSSTALTLNGGTLNLTGKASQSYGQNLGSTTFNAGASAFTINNSATSDSVDVALGTITRNVGSTVNFTLATYGANAYGNGYEYNGGTANTILTSSGVAYATVGGTDWAAKSSANNFIVPLSTITGGYTANTASTLSGNADISAGNTTLAGNTSITSLRFNAATGSTNNTVTATGETLTTGGILVGSGSGASNTYITGGTLKSAASSANLDLPVINDGTGTLTISSTIANATAGSTGVTVSGGGTTALSGVNTYTGPTWINSGTLALSGAGQLNSGSYSANVYNQGSFNDGSSAAQVLSGAISGAGTVTESGSNTLTLSGANTYSGATTVSSGTLKITGSTLSTGTVGVSNGATLSGTGSTGVVAVAAGGNINLQDGAIGTLTVGGLTSNGTSGSPGSFSFDIQTLSGTTSTDLLSDSGTLTLANVNGTTITIGALSGTTALTTGSYALISYTGTQQSLSDLHLATTSLDGATLGLSQTGDTIYLTVVGVTGTTYTLTTSASATLLHKGGSTSLNTTLTNTGTGTADSIDYSGVGASTSLGSVTGGSTLSGNLANGNTAVSNTSQTFNATTTGIATISSTGTLTNHTVGGTPTGTPTGTTITVYSGLMNWNGSSDSTWATNANWTDSTSSAVHAAPGLDSGYTGVDTATFGSNAAASTTVGLNGVSPNLNSITFSSPSTNYTLAQHTVGGSGSTGLTLSGSTPSINVTNPLASSTAGTQTISAPVILGANTSLNVASNQTLNISGQISSSGTYGLSNSGPGRTITTADNTYSGGTTISGGTFYVDNGGGASYRYPITTATNVAITATNSTGSGTGTGKVTVQSGGTLAGSGTIAPTSGGIEVQSGGTLSSGAIQSGTTAGQGLTINNSSNLSSALTVDGGATLTFALGSTTQWNGGSNTFANPNTNSTYLNLTGMTVDQIFADTTTKDNVDLVDLTNGSTSISLTLRSQQPYLLIQTALGNNADFSNVWTTGGEGANGYVLGISTGVGNGYTAFNLAAYDINGNQINTSTNLQSLRLYLYNGDLEVVPEPGTWALMLGGLALLILLQRRRNKLE